ncbi:hypothetical protein TNCV_2069981 [Trichonephila clavipes]|uniref:Uncharacterized protein n=1 Tax=Trichonephila clavipes TaxID=2585209 RepID=A0A8X7BDF4_TRICX|nr:hypothetical protein TNCV_2069981 [Trichonephila clavipes]
MRQIATEVPCGLFTVIRTWKIYSGTQILLRTGSNLDDLRKTTLSKDREKLENEKLVKTGLRGFKARPKPLLTD